MGQAAGGGGYRVAPGVGHDAGRKPAGDAGTAAGWLIWNEGGDLPALFFCFGVVSKSDFPPVIITEATIKIRGVVQVHHGTGLQSRHLRLYPVCGLAGRPGKAQSYLLVLQAAWTGGGWMSWNNGAGLDGLCISDCIIWTAGFLPPFFYFLEWLAMWKNPLL